MESRILCFYGLAVYASGLGRFFFFPGGINGLWYGLVMGSLALLGSLLFQRGRRGAGFVTGFLAMTFVGGWYAWECFMVKGLAEAEWRQLIMIGVSVMAGVLLAKKYRGKES